MLKGFVYLCKLCGTLAVRRVPATEIAHAGRAGRMLEDLVLTAILFTCQGKEI